MAETRLTTSSFKCDGDCGSKFELTGHSHSDVSDSVLHSIAELLGWTTRDKPGKSIKNHDVLVFCSHCQKQARLILGK